MLIAGAALAALVSGVLLVLEGGRAPLLPAAVLAFVAGAGLEWLRTSRGAVALLGLVLVAGATAFLATSPTGQDALWRVTDAPRGLLERLGRRAPAPRAVSLPSPTPQLPGRPTGPASGATPDAPAFSRPDDPRPPASALRRLEHWLRADGLDILYNAAVYLEGACTGEVVGVGNFGGAGWRLGTPARCRAGGWVAVDLRPLLRSGRVLRDRTYCIDIRDARGRRGEHVQHGAPDLEAVRVPGPRGEGRALGFRVEDRLFGDRIVLTNVGHQWLEC